MSKLKPAEVFLPGELIQDELDARGWDARLLAKQSQLAEHIVREILIGHRKITPIFSRCLGTAFGVSHELFLRLQATWDEGENKL